MEKIMITGHLGQDVRVNQHQNETVASFSVAASRRSKNADGTYKETTTWYNCTLWRPGKVTEYLKKGTQVLVEGQPRARHFKTRTGEDAASIEITVSHVELLGSSKAAEPGPTKPEDADVIPENNGGAAPW